jgi:hypothetical protein
MSVWVPFLAALLLHSLLLAAAGLRPTRPAAAPPQRADDTPELLVFSRLPPEPLPSDQVPLPPPDLLPAPPPPPLPSRPLRPRLEPRASKPGAPAAGAAATPKPSAKANSKPITKANLKGYPKANPKAPAKPGTPAPARVPPSAGAQVPPPPTASTSGATPVQPEQASRWRLLWQSAEAGAALPPPPGGLAAALALAPPSTELRRLPLQRARTEGLEPVSGQVLRLDGQRLLLWIDGPDLWLLRTPA